MSGWHLYIIRCRDGTLYTGITTNVGRRLAEHKAGKGARYVRGRTPLELVFNKKVGDKGTALRAEAAVKRISRAQKEELVNHPRKWTVIMRKLRQT